ncbi:MAG: threonine synthase [Deltaproteobacteria bacterium]|nr:threonine synthase [Deltaproteobacteria bacterium]
MGIVKGLTCPKCGREADSRTIFQCASCGVALEAIVDIESLSKAQLLEIRSRNDPTIWRWFEFFPVEKRSAIVSLGEGFTPLLRCPGLCEKIDIAELYLKNDTVLPTGSLKDRSNAVALSKARELGFKTASVVSTGNAAASVAAYAAVAGLNGVVMVPEGTSPSKVAQASAYGATVLVLRGDFDRVAAVYRQAVREFDWYDCLSTNPYRNEGKKSYAYELFDQMCERVPDWIIHPTAGGTGVCAIWKGYNELLRLGWISRLPRVVAAQSEAAAPFIAALQNGSTDIEPVIARDTVAESLQVGNPKTLGFRTLKAIRNSHGTAVALSDDEILTAQSVVARCAGVFAEPAGAISVAAARRLRQEGAIRRDELVVCNITGHGLKQPQAIEIPGEELRPIPAELGAIRERLESNNEKC